MIGTLYRYPHPLDPTRFIYVGQGAKRDGAHRSGKSSFGRRFKMLFPDVDLPQPIREQIEISGQLELNEEETIWMVRYHTWCGYSDGMNLCLPGSSDYISIGKRRTEIYGNPHTPEGSAKGGYTTIKLHGNPGTLEGSLKGGRAAVTSGQLDYIRRLPQTKEAQRKAGRKNAESGHLKRIHNLPQSKKAYSENGTRTGLIQGRKNVESGLLARLRTPEHQSKAGTIGSCLQWNIKRGKPCTCGKHIKVTET